MSSTQSRHRRRQFCTACGRVHRISEPCESAEPDTARLIAQVPDLAPYPYNSVNLSKAASELVVNAVVKERNGKTAEARHSLQLAARRLEEAEQLEPDLAGYFQARAKAIRMAFLS